MTHSYEALSIEEIHSKATWGWLKAWEPLSHFVTSAILSPWLLSCPAIHSLSQARTQMANAVAAEAKSTTVLRYLFEGLPK